MIFEIRSVETYPNGTEYYWWLRSKNGVVCKSVTNFASVEEARSDIADAKRSFAGSKYAKVEVV